MILVDLSQIMMASTMMSMEKGQTEADVDFIRHMVLNSLRMYRTEYNEKYGELVICSDSPHSWRREHFPQYKAGRKTGREESPLNWTQIFGCFETIKEEDELGSFGCELREVSETMFFMSCESLFVRFE